MPISYGLTNTFRLGTVLATLSVTLERYFAIVLPLKDLYLVKKCLVPLTIVVTGDTHFMTRIRYKIIYDYYSYISL